MMSTGAAHEVLEIGVISPEMVPAQGLSVGEVGYLITGVKDVRQSRVGDTVTNASKPSEKDLGGYQHPKPMVYSGLFPIDAKDFPDLRDALDKLQLNDAALVYEPETSTALGFGFRVGFLGLLHMEIVRERLEREFDLDLISTAPSVVHHVLMEDGSTVTVTNPSEYPTSGRIARCVNPSLTPPFSVLPSTSAPSLSCVSNVVVFSKAWIICRLIEWKSGIVCRSRRSFSTSLTSSSRVLKGMLRWIITKPVSRLSTSLRSTFCSTEIRWTL
ncbi:translation elongation factor LepA [Cutibacterium acnes JCM 18909]|nr:translation elongation factor LepA [Cutibacterium acnes JCM 18909]